MEATMRNYSISQNILKPLQEESLVSDHDPRWRVLVVTK